MLSFICQISQCIQNMQRGNHFCLDKFCTYPHQTLNGMLKLDNGEFKRDNVPISQTKRTSEMFDRDAILAVCDVSGYFAES